MKLDKVIIYYAKCGYTITFKKIDETLSVRVLTDNKVASLAIPFETPEEKIAETISELTTKLND